MPRSRVQALPTLGPASCAHTNTREQLPAVIRPEREFGMTLSKAMWTDRILSGRPVTCRPPKKEQRGDGLYRYRMDC